MKGCRNQGLRGAGVEPRKQKTESSYREALTSLHTALEAIRLNGEVDIILVNKGLHRLHLHRLHLHD